MHISWISSRQVWMCDEDMDLYQVELLSTAWQMVRYWTCVITTMLPPLSDGLMTISLRFCSSFNAACWLEVRLGWKTCHWLHFKSLMDYCRNAQIAGHVMRSGNFRDLGLHFCGLSVVEDCVMMAVGVGAAATPDWSTERGVKGSPVDPSSYSSIKSRNAQNSLMVKSLVLSVNSRSRIELWRSLS